jgi:hypothetical protein
MPASGWIGAAFAAAETRGAPGPRIARATSASRTTPWALACASSVVSSFSRLKLRWNSVSSASASIVSASSPNGTPISATITPVARSAQNIR